MRPTLAVTEPKERKRLLAVTSGGGHWDEMLLVRESFADFDVTYASTIPNVGKTSGISNLVLRDFNRNHPLRIITAFWDALRLVRRLKPSVVFSTGAAPGLVVLLAGRILGARTVWLDSVANAEKLSLSGAIARHFVDLHTVQWEHLADGQRTKFFGQVL